MSERIRIMRSPTLTVNAAGNGFDEPSYTTGTWSWDSTTGAVASRRIDGEILKIFLDFGAANVDASATITITDTITGATVYSKSISWQTDATVYPRVAVCDSAGTAGAAGDNLWTPVAVNGTATVDCASATDNDTVTVYIFYR